MISWIWGGRIWERLSGPLHHKIRLSLVILFLFMCPAQNVFISRRYTLVHV